MRILLVALLLFLAGCGYHSVDLPLSSKQKSCEALHIQNRMQDPWLLGYIYRHKKIVGQIRLKQDIVGYLKTLLPCTPLDIVIQEFTMRYLPDLKGPNLWARLTLKVTIRRPNHLWIKDILVVRKERVGWGYQKALTHIAKQMLQEAAKEIKRVAKE